jgi:hypothetical protein
MPDVFETFAHRVDDLEPDHPGGLPGIAVVVRSAGVTLGLMVVASTGFVVGAWLAWRARPGTFDRDVVWEGLVLLAWCTAWGAFSAAAALAIGVLAVGLPWVRRQRAHSGRDTSTSTP